jgi:hypothetical protein
MIPPDENVARHRRDATASYHCPNTMCDGHFYLRSADLGVQQKCPKCELYLTIGRHQVVPSFSGVTGSDSTSTWMIVAALVGGVLVGFLMGYMMR